MDSAFRVPDSGIQNSDLQLVRTIVGPAIGNDGMEFGVVKNIKYFLELITQLDFDNNLSLSSFLVFEFKLKTTQILWKCQKLAWKES